MDCASCWQTIQTAIDRMPGVSELRISVARERMQLLLDEKQTGQEKIVKAVKSLRIFRHADWRGSRQPEPRSCRAWGCKLTITLAMTTLPMIIPVHDHDHDHGTCGDHAAGSHEAEPVAKAGQTVMKVGGMDCASCRRHHPPPRCRECPASSDVQVSVAREQMTLTLAPGMTSIGQIQDAVRKLGFTAEMPSAAAAAADAGLPSEPEAQRKKAWWQAPKAKQLGIAAARPSAAPISPPSCSPTSNTGPSRWPR